MNNKKWSYLKISADRVVSEYRRIRRENMKKIRMKEKAEYAPLVFRLLRFGEADVVRASFGNDGNTDDGWIDEDVESVGGV